MLAIGLLRWPDRRTLSLRSNLRGKTCICPTSVKRWDKKGKLQVIGVVDVVARTDSCL